jgi:hypothetical protein
VCMLRFLIILFVWCGCASSGRSQMMEPREYTGARYDSSYLSKRYRDSVHDYTYRVHSYRWSLLNYDLGMTLSFFPVLGEWYVDNTSRGIMFAAGRAGAAAVSVIGVAGLFTKGNTARDIGFAVGGLAIYAVLKYLEIVDVQHAISRNNERVAQKFDVHINDVESSSIRYPEHDHWPARVTSRPPARVPQPAREIIDRPIPKLEESLSIGVQLTF